MGRLLPPTMMTTIMTRAEQDEMRSKKQVKWVPEYQAEEKWPEHPKPDDACSDFTNSYSSRAGGATDGKRPGLVRKFMAFLFSPIGICTLFLVWNLPVLMGYIFPGTTTTSTPSSSSSSPSQGGPRLVANKVVRESAVAEGIVDGAAETIRTGAWGSIIGSTTPKYSSLGELPQCGKPLSALLSRECRREMKRGRIHPTVQLHANETLVVEEPFDVDCMFLSRKCRQRKKHYEQIISFKEG